MTGSIKNIISKSVFFFAGVALLLFIENCEVKNDNKTTCDENACTASCKEQGYEEGACEGNRCTCKPSDSELYSFTGSDSGDTDTDSDTDSDTDTDTDTDADMDTNADAGNKDL